VEKKSETIYKKEKPRFVPDLNGAKISLKKGCKVAVKTTAPCPEYNL